MATSNMADPVGRVLGGRYRVVAPLGAGASAVVYLAEDVSLRRHVAVKVLHAGLADDPTFLKRFQAEAQAAAALSHPHVVAVFDWGQEGGAPYLVTEHLGGGTLRSVLDRGHLLSPSQALVVGLEAARGLDYAHRQGFVHRDIKPANLLFDTEGRLRVADFGLARALAEAAWTEPAGVVLGTARYASPEQARGQAVDGRSDVYSLALVLVEAVTGTVPFSADTTVATLMARLDALLRVPAELGPLAPVLERAGRPDPAERPSAGELAKSLLQAAERLPRPAPLPLVRTAVPVEQARRAPATPAAPARRASAAPPSDVTTLGPRLTAAVETGAGVVDDVTVVARRVADRTTIGPPPTPHEQAQAAGGAGTPPRRRRRRRWPWAAVTVVLLAAALALGAWFLVLRDDTPSYALPDFTTGSVDQAVADPLFADALLVRDVVRQRQDGTTPGQVLGQDPPPGTEVDEGSVVRLVVSDGPTLALVPDLGGGISQADAKARLEAAGFPVGTVSPQADEAAAPDVVLDWTLKGTEQVKGTPVDLVVSSGPAPRTVPVVVGLPVADAVAALAAVQLPTTTSDEFSDTVEAGKVIRIDPGEGATVARDTPIAVVVSKGPDLVRVPEVSGQSVEDAVASLRAAGFVEGQVSGRAGRPVLATDPRAGTSIKRGSRVDLIVG